MVELIVVVAVVATLAGILLPAVGRSKDRAVVTSCGSNMKQMGTAMTMYADDNEDHYINHEGTTAQTWATARSANMEPLFAFYATPEVTVCPSMPEDKSGTFMSMVIVGGNSAVWDLMRYNQVSVRRVADYEAADFAEVPPTAPARVLAGDLMYGYDGSNNYVWTQADPNAGSAYSAAHRGRVSNSVFEDGHVSEISTGLSGVPPSFAVWNSTWNFQNGGRFFSGAWSAMPSVGVIQ